MAKTERDETIGLAMWRQVGRFCTRQEVIVQPMRRENGRDYPVGISYSFATEPTAALADLRLDASVSDYERSDGTIEAYRAAPSYREVYSVTAGRAKVMADLLTKFEREQRKADAYEHGDAFAVFAKVCGASWVCCPKGCGDEVPGNDGGCLMAWLEKSRLFCCVMPAGIRWADREVMRDGDYAPLAFLPFRSLTLEFDKRCPPQFKDGITREAARIQERRREQFQVSSSGQTVILGS